MDNSDSFFNILKEYIINRNKQCTGESTFIEDKGIRVFPIYKDELGTSVFYPSGMKRISKDEKNKD